MKNLLYLLWLPLLLLSCNRKNPEPLPAIKEIAGKWRLEANEKIVNGQKVWEKVSVESSYSLIFRYDGVVLDKNGYGLCCPPDSLVVNGVPFKIKPMATTRLNPQCAYIDCASCPSWGLERNGDELIISQNCAIWNFRSKYVRN